MLYLASVILSAVYVALPVAMLVRRLLVARRTGNRRPAYQLIGVGVTGLLIGAGLTLAYAHFTQAHAPLTQMLLASYFATGMLLILRAFNEGLFALTRSLARARTALQAYLLAAVFSIGRVLLLFAIGLPYVMGTVMAYRTKVTPIDSPMTQLGVPYERVTFDASDGTRIVGWWLPATGTGDRARRTVLVCHGLASNKSNHLILGRSLIAAGYNLLSFDFRAHGESGGQLSTFGDRERLDVLAAVRWVKTERPDRAERVFGVGASMGAAALVAAAGDASPEGQRIDAVAVYGTYDDLGALADTITTDAFPRPLGWLLRHVGVPVASLHVGRDLTAFRPADAIANIWPRPVLVIHGTYDEIIRFEHGHRLYQRALQPKQRLWIQGGMHNGIVEDEGAGATVVDFFDDARSLL